MFCCQDKLCCPSYQQIQFQEPLSMADAGDNWGPPNNEEDANKIAQIQQAHTPAAQAIEQMAVQQNAPTMQNATLFPAAPIN